MLLGVVPALVVSALLAIGMAAGTGWTPLLVWPLAAAVPTFVVYAFDKFQAGRHGVRIPEDALLILTLAGGVIGSTLAMLLLRHKTQHTRFWLTQAAAAIIYGGLWLAAGGLQFG
jgi:uncharacterized membrane protein YsdA (DUF1294 family)